MNKHNEETQKVNHVKTLLSFKWLWKILRQFNALGYGGTLWRKANSHGETRVVLANGFSCGWRNKNKFIRQSMEFFKSQSTCYIFSAAGACFQTEITHRYITLCIYSRNQSTRAQHLASKLGFVCAFLNNQCTVNKFSATGASFSFKHTYPNYIYFACFLKINT